MRTVILLDPGHGGHDPGAEAHDLVEAQINLEVCQRLADELIPLGFAPLLTRYTDRTVSPEERVGLDRLHRPDLFLSVHCNAAHTSRAQGFEVFTSRGETLADPAATALIDALRAAFPAERFRTDPTDGDPDKEAGFYVLRNTLTPAVLVELGFLTNLADAGRLSSETHRGQLAAALVSGIGAHFKNLDLGRV